MGCGQSLPNPKPLWKFLDEERLKHARLLCARKERLFDLEPIYNEAIYDVERNGARTLWIEAAPSYVLLPNVLWPIILDYAADAEYVRYSLWSGRMRCDHAQTFEDHTFSTPNMQVNVRVLTYDLNQAPSISGTCGRALPNPKRCQDLQLALFRAEQIAIRNAIASWFNGRPNLSAQHLDYFYRYEWIREQNKWLHAREEALKRS